MRRKIAFYFNLVFFACVFALTVNSITNSWVGLEIEEYIEELEIAEMTDEEILDLEYLARIPDRYKDISIKINNDYKIPFRIIYRLVKKESDWIARASSRVPNANGSIDYGLAGINGNYVDYYREKFFDEEFVSEFYGGEFNIMNPYINLQIGFRYLRHLLDYYDQDMISALYAYNAGINRIREYVPAVTVRYANFIMTGSH